MCYSGVFVQAADVILSSALIDREEIVRYEATLQYIRHPKADEMSDILSDYYNYTKVQQSPAGATNRRIRRFNIFNALSFHLQSPSFNWRKQIGSDEFGASMGLIIRNVVELDIKPLSGKFEVDVHNEAYFVAYITYINLRFDIFRARVCFKGYIAYNFNILQEFGINSFSDLANIYDRTIGAVVTPIKQAVESFRGAYGDVDVSYIFDRLVDAVSELPFIIDNLVVSPTLRRILQQLQQLPFIQKGLMLIDDVNSLYEDVRSDVLMFYQEISDCVTVTLPWVGETVKKSIETIGKSIKEFFRNPLTAIRDVIVSVFQLRTAIDAVIDCKDVLIKSAKFEGAHIRGWMELLNHLGEIYTSTIEAKELIMMQAQIFSEARDASTFEQATGLNLTILRIKVYEDLRVALDEFIQPLSSLRNIIDPFIVAFANAIQLIKNTISAYETLKNAFELARNLIEQLFGLKFDRRFPRKLRGDDGCEVSNCQCGFYPTTSGNPDTYKIHTYKPGIQLEVVVLKSLVAPTNGLYLRIPDDRVLIFPSGSLKRYVIMIHHVALMDNITYEGINVQSGEKIGTVTDTGCYPNFIHVTVMTRSGKPLDPSRFLKPRSLVFPEWIEECNDYKLVVLGDVIREGEVIGKPEKEKKKERGSCTDGEECTDANIAKGVRPPRKRTSYTPKHQQSISKNSKAKSKLLANATSNGPNGPMNHEIDTDLKEFLTREDIEEYSNSGDFSLVVGGGRGKDYNFSVNSIILGTLIDALSDLDDPEINEVITTLENTIDCIREAVECSNDQLIDPSLLDLTSIKSSLKVRGLSAEGDKEQLLARLIELPTDLCPDIQAAIPRNRWCSISDDCLTLKCAAALKLDFLSYSVTFQITLDPCTSSIMLKFQDFERVIDLPAISGGLELNIPIESVDLLDIATLNLGVKIVRDDLNIFLNFKAYLCAPDTTSEDYSHCFFDIELLARAVFKIPSPFNCNSNERKRETREIETSDVTSCGIHIPDFSNMTLAEFVTYIKDLGDIGSAGASTTNINQLMQDLRNVFLTDLLDSIISGESTISGEETDFPTTFDICVMGSFGVQKVRNFFTKGRIVIIGFVPVSFLISLDGFYGVDLNLKLCFITMAASAEVIPRTGLILTGSVGLSIAIAEVGVKLVGRILDTSLPIQPTIGFKKFPLALRIRIDLKIIPLSISIRFFLKIEFTLLFITVSETLFDHEVFHWSAPAILINLLDVTNAEQDDSPPLFSPIADSTRSRRSLATPCDVSQIVGRDYTDPAFFLQINVADDKSQVELTYSVGTYPGGNDVVRDDRMNGNTVLIARQLLSSIPLYWTAKASNSQGVSAASECSLPTYDTTLPIGRVDFMEYIYSSHPSILIGETTIIDDTNLKRHLQAIGYGLGPFGDQTVGFISFDFEPNTPISVSGTIENFIAVLNKRLGVIPFKVSSGKELEECATDCLQFPTKCFSFNYAPVSHICELLNDIGGDSSLEFAYDLQYSYYEKRGVGYRASLKHDNLPLVHNTLYFLNIYLMNELLYERYLHSPGILIDFTPPEPGMIVNASMNETRHDGCSAAFNQRCEPPQYVTPLKYHHVLQDGAGSECVYNGPVIGTDKMYTRQNSFLSIVFHGFHDLESGIYAYTWYMDYEICEDNVITPRDPNEHSTTPLSDINQGRIFQHFDDGTYYVTVQALNKVILGGSGVLTVCHSTPYTIDTSPPVISRVILISYNSNTNLSIFVYQAWDVESGLKAIELGAGLTPNDISILLWTPIFVNQTATITYRIDVADGQRAFIRIKATNNVDLESASYAPEPIIVDRSPPIPGVVLDGDGFGLSDFKYQSSASKICAKWKNFFDPQSGVSAYRWGVGTAPGMSNIVAFTEDLPSDQNDICRDGLTLQHNTTYYSTIIAFNADTHQPKNSSASSNGVLVDLTNPIGGYVLDGLEITNTIHYTSNPTLVQAVWGNFSDPESGISQYNVTIYVANVLQFLPATNLEPDQECQITSTNTIVPTRQHFIPPSDVEFRIAQESLSVGLEHQIHYKHFHFSHGEYIRTRVTGQDGATRLTEVTSQGVLVDLTPPKIVQLYDGANFGIDESYQTSITVLHASWIMVDKESGISEYQLSIYARSQGSTSKFYPEDAPYITLQPQEIGESGILNCWTGRDIPLSIGTLYTVRIVPVNRAKLSTIYTSNGIIPDNTPPVIDFVHIGTYGDESEEITPQENAVEIGNSGKIPVQWSASDSQSGIIGFVAAIGTSPEGIDTSDYTEYSASINVGIPVQLQLFEVTGNYYYVTVRAKNGAGLLSEPTVSSKIKVLRANVAGVVTVGHSGIGIDGGFQAESDTITLKFDGFSSELCGIQYFEWSIGTSFAGDQIQEFTTAGLVMGEDGSGVSQALVPLHLGRLTYTEVRAITACSSGDGQATINSFGQAILVDWTKPNLILTELGQQIDGVTYKYPQSDDKIYQYDPSTLVARWSATDPQSGINNIQYHVGTYPYTANIQLPKLTRGTSLASNDVEPENTGEPNILHLIAFNKAGVSTFLIAPGITIDTLIPNTDQLRFTCTQYAVTTTSSLVCNWYGAFDEYSEVNGYEIMLGEEEIDTTFYYEYLDRNAITVTIRNFTKPLEVGDQVYTLNVINSVRLSNHAFAPLTIDDSPPIPQSVFVLTDQTQVAFFPTGEVNSTFNYENATSSGVQCKIIVTDIHIRWEDFVDHETPMDFYEIGIGEKRGQMNIVSFFNVGLVNEYFIEGLDLTRYKVIYAIIRGTNRVGLIQAANSNPIYLSLRYPDPGYVYDGSEFQDLEAQAGITFLEGYWNFNDPCPAVHYDWAIFYMNQTTIQNFTRVETSHSSNDNLAMQQDTKVYISVTVYSSIGYVRSSRSNGITIQVDPLIPGVVYDGPVPGYDFDSQASLTSIIANWNSFGGTDPERLSEMVIQYEIAVGTGWRGEDRFNVVEYENMYLNTSATLRGLELQRNTSYYVTIRGTSGTFQQAEATSNGIQPIEFNNIAEPGSVEIPSFQSATTLLDITWKDFTSLLPIAFYEYAISTDGNLAEFSCETVENAADPLDEYFTVRQYTRAVLQASVVADNLHLVGATKYYAYVRAIDNSFQCTAAVSHPIVIDTTPPIQGKFNIGFNVTSVRPELTETQIYYITGNDTLAVHWEGFFDPESYISNYQIAIIEQDNCNIHNCDEISDLTEFTTINNVNNYTFYVIQLVTSKFYFVALRSINQAALTSCSVSQPIKLVKYSLNPAVVKYGTIWKFSPPYQGSTSRVEGVLALVRTKHDAVCMERMYNQSSTTEDWDTITQSITSTIPVGPSNPTGRTLMYHPQQIEFTTDSAFLKVSMTRDIQRERMLSGAAVTQMSVVDLNEMSVSIKAAPEFQAVTSVLFWDGPASMVQEYEMLYELENVTQTNFGQNLPTQTPSTCQYMPPPNPNPVPYKAFGLQLHPSYNSSPARALFWYRGQTPEDTGYTWIDLDYDPSAAFYTYDFKLYRTSSTTPSTATLGTWTVDLVVDGQFLGNLVDLPQLRSSIYLVLHVRNFNGGVESFSNPFFPPTTSAYFTDVNLPADSSRVCKFGAPFYSPKAPFVKFEVGVGREYGSTEVSLAAGREYQSIPSPCIPCVEGCNNSLPNLCNSTCNSNVYYIQFVASGLSLQSGCTHPFNLTNVTCTPYNYTDTGIPEDQLYQYNITFVPYVYYMKVRGYTATGEIAYGYSDGIQLDTTPPNCTLIQHVQRDLRSDQLIQTSAQDSDNSLAVEYQCEDTKSDIYDYEIAYSDNVTDIDSLQFTSVGTIKTANITNLELIPQLKYYVIVRAINGAGLSTILVSQGVRIMNQEPDISKSVIEPLYSTKIDTIIPNTFLSTQLTSLGLHWTGFYPTHYEDNYLVKNQTIFWKVGTEPYKDDIMPIFEITFGNASSIRIEGSQLIGNGNSNDQVIANTPDIIMLANKSAGIYTGSENILQAEPGMILYQTLVLCAIQPKCKDAGTPSVTYYRDTTDTYAVYQRNSEYYLSIEEGFAEYSSGFSGQFIPQLIYPTNCKVYFSEDLQDLSGFVIGPLSLSDMKVNYDILSVPFSSPYTRYIVDPGSTLTQVDRFLFTRIQEFHGPSFYISPIGGVNFPSWLKIEIKFNASRIVETNQPFLVGWNPEQQQWVSSRSSCNFDKEDTITGDTLTTYFCPCLLSNERCNKPWQFILVVGSATFDDTPPIPDQVPCISIGEGSVTIQHLITYTDIEHDTVNISLTSVTFTRASSEYSLAEDGTSLLNAEINGNIFYFTPCSGCYGNLSVQYSLTETGTPSLLGTPLYADNEFLIEILSVNENPKLMIDQENVNSLITLYRTDNTSVVTLQLTGYSYDVDDGDYVYFRYLNCSYCKLVVSEISPSSNPNISAQYTTSSRNFSLNYTALAYYYGTDQFGIVSLDRFGAFSLAYIIVISIRFKPCLNDATCKGPNNDPDCSKIIEIEDFSSEYSCECTEEWALRRCDKPNLCLSQPCHYNATCQIKENGDYECLCEPGWRCSQILTPGEISAVVLSIVIILLIIAVVSLIVCVYLMQKRKGVYNIGIAQRNNIIIANPAIVQLEEVRARVDVTEDALVIESPFIEETIL
ncbi:hypothetical protein LOD99_2114 [Oopsacas minuta]|uniref:Uncharacterized protein n=1 Tax=Oopsacas minuta TaxID=111878 RepID=A0AAV7K5L0_9METZ|nr:hypothetical protein LOD99_2114 [Oopsacas minuta]